MKIEHIAIWVQDLEKMKEFYLKFFDVNSNDKYHNPTKNFSSYFLSFENGARIELMHKPEVSELIGNSDIKLGLAHFAISLGSEGRVNELTNEIQKKGFKVIGEPRVTGDGYYESVIADPEGNSIELTV